jgi:hypothetical protein
MDSVCGVLVATLLGGGCVIGWICVCCACGDPVRTPMDNRIYPNAQLNAQLVEDPPPYGVTPEFIPKLEPPPYEEPTQLR